MGKYTIKGSAELEARIDSDMQHIAERTAPLTQAGILIGGYGRGEGTPYVQPSGEQLPFNDYDLVVMVEKLTRDLRNQLKQLEQELTQELGIPVDLCPYRLNRLSRCEFSLLNYEMKNGHHLIWGHENPLAELPDFPLTELPRSEGTRLLLNRGKLLLDIKHRLEHSGPLTTEERERFIKFIFKMHLALGDCALLDAEIYDVLYTDKKEHIRELGAIPHRDYIVERFLQAVELKEWGDYSALTEFNVVAEFKTLREVFLAFFPWYRKRHTDDREAFYLSFAKNLIWYKRPLLQHPRTHLYDALPELLSAYPDEHFLRRVLFCRDNFSDTFYKLQRRFA